MSHSSGVGFGRWLVCAFPLSLLAACGPPVRDVALVHVVATAELGCGACTPTASLTVAPHCGFDVRPLDGGTMEISATFAPKDVTGVLVVDERLLTPTADQPLVQRRAVITAQARVFPAFPSAAPALYEVDATGALRVLLDGGVLDGGLAQFRYDVTLTDGGAATVLETHAVDGVSTQRASIEDHGSDPFSGCCESAGAGSLAPALLALLGVRRRLARRPRL